ncbi:MAG: site-2 protease family protein [Clostridiales bacterium]|nr:site-2 protease family protein [Clostridiales bacterium]
MFNISSILINVPITLIALTFHEFAHGWVSSKLGDPTPRNEGRLTLNPLAHLDPIGTLLMILTGFGWARPVGVNPMYYRDRKKGMAIVGAAGPLMNFLLAFGAVLIYGIYAVVCMKLGTGLGALSYMKLFVQVFVFRNLCFMVFNLIPIPPLDGSRIFTMFFSDRIYYTLMQYERYSMLLIMVLSLTGALNSIIGTGVNFFANMLFNVLNNLIGIFM